MWPSVRSRLLPWLARWEGSVSWMYLDVLGRVATGIGTDLNSPQAANALIWRHPGGQQASPDEVVHEWLRVKAMTSSAKLGGGNAVWRDSAHLTVDPDSLAEYPDALLEGYESVLRTRIQGYDALPGPAQLARLRTAYAEGPGARWPKLDAALSAQDWATAVEECSPGDYARQNASYRASYDAVCELYRIAPDWPGDSLPDVLPGEPGYGATSSAGVASNP